MGQVVLNTKKLARDARQMLDSANAHLLATGVKNLNAYLYAAMARGALESAMSILEMTADDETGVYRQLSQLDAEAVTLCSKFEAMFDIRSKQSEPVSVVKLAPQPTPEGNGHVRSYKLQPHTGQLLSGSDHSHRLTASERLEIWQHFQEHPNPSRSQVLEVAVLYKCTEDTVSRWIENHPGEHE